MKRLLLLVVFTSYLYFYFHASFFVRYSRGVQPLTLRNVALKRLIVLNPHEKAMSVMGRSVVMRSRSTWLIRSFIR